MEDKRRKNNIKIKRPRTTRDRKKTHCVLKDYVLLKGYRRRTLVTAEFVKIDKI